MCSSHEIQATLNALGYLEDGEYYKSRDCLNGAKDLIRYLRRDDPNEKTIRRELLKSDVISNDLIPMMRTFSKQKASSSKNQRDSELFDIVLRLLVNLTQPAINCFELKIPEDKIQFNIYLEIDSRLKQVKEAFANEEFVRVLNSKLNGIVFKEWKDRPEEDDLVVERILLLLRNILLIKPSDEETESRLATDLNSHDLLIMTFNKTDLLDTLIKMTSNSLNSKYTVHILEIITLLLSEQSPEELARVSENEPNMNSKRSVVEKEKDHDELAMLAMKDTQMRKYNKTRLNPRHSRFMGTYVVQNMKSINDENKLIVHKAAKNMDDLLDDSSKKAVRKPKNKIVTESDDQFRKSVMFVRVLLKKFCVNLMNSSYGSFFRNVKDMVQRKKLEDEEMCYYFWSVQFFTEFVRHWDASDEQTKIELLKETFSLEMFHTIEVFIQRCYEMIKVDKKQDKLWAKRMHTSLKCYKENLLLLFLVEKKSKEPPATALTPIATNTVASNKEDDLIDLDDFSKPVKKLIDLKKTNTNTNEAPPVVRRELDEKSLQLLSKIKEQLFYIQEFREMFVNMLRDFDSSKMSKNFLRDLIEANHIFILMLENQKKQGELNVASKKKKKKLKASKKSKKVKETKEEKQKRLDIEKEYQKRLDQQQPDYKKRIWECNFLLIADLVQNNQELSVQEDNLMPFDFAATNDQEFDEQKDSVVEKIQRLIIEKKPSDSIALFREARCLWPKERELFGQASDQGTDEEFETFKNLFMKPIEIKKPQVDNQDEEKTPEDDEGLGNDGGEEDEEVNEIVAEFEEESQEEDDEKRYEVQEESLDFEKFLFRYTHPHILKCFILMLGEYTKNSDLINRCCMNMFERIAYECHAPQCLYQLSLFHLINKLYKDPMSRCIMNIMDTNSQAAQTNQSALSQIYSSTYSSEDMFAFFRQLIFKFFEQTKLNDKLFLELMFFKDKKIVFELGEESTGYQPIEQKKNGNKRTVAWTQEEQDELKQLFDKFKPRFDDQFEDDLTDFQEKDQDACDIIDLIILHVKDGNRTRREIITQLVNLKCVHSADVFKTDAYRFQNAKHSKPNRSYLWRDEDVADLRQSFALLSDEAKSENKPLSEIMNKLQACLKINRPTKVIIQKLVDLKLAEASELIVKKKKKNKETNDMNSGDEFLDDSDNETKKKKKEKKKKSKEKKSESDEKSNDLFDADEASQSASDSEAELSASESESESVKSDNEQVSSPAKTKSPVKPTQRRIANKRLLKLINGYSSDEDEENKSDEHTNKLIEDTRKKMSLSPQSESSSSDDSIKKSKKRSMQVLNDSDDESIKSKTKSVDDEATMTSDSDDDVPLKSLGSHSKRQKLILDNDDDDE